MIAKENEGAEMYLRLMWDVWGNVELHKTNKYNIVTHNNVIKQQKHYGLL